MRKEITMASVISLSVSVSSMSREAFLCIYSGIQNSQMYRPLQKVMTLPVLL